MITHELALETDLFNALTPAPGSINPRCFGEDFALWVRDRLSGAGLESASIVQEDFGWVVLQPFRGFVFTIALGVEDNAIGTASAAWHLTVAYEKPLNRVKTWFSSPPLTELRDLTQVLTSVLLREPRIRNLRAE